MTWTHDTILQAGHSWKDATGDYPAQHHWNPARAKSMVDSLMLRVRSHRAIIDLFEAGGFPSDWTVKREFGSWNGYLAALGREPRATGRQPRVIPAKRLTELRLVQEQRPVAAGPAVLKAALQHVDEARRENDQMMLRGALYELAAVSIAWMDELDANQEPLACPRCNPRTREDVAA